MILFDTFLKFYSHCIAVPSHFGGCPDCGCGAGLYGGPGMLVPVRGAKAEV